MNSIVIKTKLESLRKCLDRIELKKPQSLEDLIRDIDAQDILALNLERSVQLCVDIANHILSSLDDTPAMSMGESFERLSVNTMFKDFSYKDGDFPIADKVTNECLSLPMSLYLKSEDQNIIINQILNFKS